MPGDPRSQYEAIQRRVERLDGSLHPTAASAQLAGYRACKRCSPDAAPRPGRRPVSRRSSGVLKQSSRTPQRDRGGVRPHGEPPGRGSINGSARRTAPRGTI
ncbi:hypothetical protein NLX85_17060 [Micromonospora sp. A3M-1-15]|uniref:Ada metal-binding domain-containing protein n=1 Tax=Micromonospora TaxID=1873 RepID=UPI0020B7305C|nr:Ada metal-binding domain-containing protein [Micromonospora sp. A3M-1-15]MCP3785080.1 hypothetical protein [Micromonospora sp. A3M-1-15]